MSGKWSAVVAKSMHFATPSRLSSACPRGVKRLACFLQIDQTIRPAGKASSDFTGGAVNA